MKFQPKYCENSVAETKIELSPLHYRQEEDYQFGTMADKFRSRKLRATKPTFSLKVAK